MLRIPHGLGNWFTDGGKVVRSTRRALLPRNIIFLLLLLISVRDWMDPRHFIRFIGSRTRILHISRRRYWLTAPEEELCAKNCLRFQTLRWYKVSARRGVGDRWFVIVSTVRIALWFRSNVFTQTAHVWYIKPTDTNGNCASRQRQVTQIASVNCREIRQGGALELHERIYRMYGLKFVRVTPSAVAPQTFPTQEFPSF
jgi:ribosomal protein S18